MATHQPGTRLWCPVYGMVSVIGPPRRARGRIFYAVRCEEARDRGPFDAPQRTGDVVMVPAAQLQPSQASKDGDE